jgi:hypothetical protein
MALPFHLIVKNICGRDYASFLPAINVPCIHKSAWYNVDR